MTNFTLEPMTPEQVDADRAARRSAELKRKMQEQINKPLTGNTGNLGQAALFNDIETDLFAGPSAEQYLKKMKT